MEAGVLQTFNSTHADSSLSLSGCVCLLFGGIKNFVGLSFRLVEQQRSSRWVTVLLLQQIIWEEVSLGSLPDSDRKEGINDHWSKDWCSDNFFG